MKIVRKADIKEENGLYTLYCPSCGLSNEYKVKDVVSLICNNKKCKEYIKIED